MNITILGSCANQISNREGVAMLVETNNDNLLIDCGPGIVAAFGRACRKTSDINNVLLTHVHGDHTAGFAYFVWNRNFERMGGPPADDLHVFGAKETINLAKFSLEHSYPELSFPFKIIYHVIESNDTFRCGALSVLVCSATHAVPCLACIVHGSGKKFAYSSDSVPNATFEALAKDADILIHEGMMPESMSILAAKVKHSTSYQAGVSAANVHAKQLVLVHIAPGLCGKESMLLEEAGRAYSGHVSIPFDGTVYRV